MADRATMDYQFKTVAADYGNTMSVPLTSPYPDIRITEQMVPGFVVQYFEKYNSEPLITGAGHLFSELSWGNLRPDLILSSEKMMKRVVYCLKENERQPVMYGCNFGFLFQSAIWSHPDNTGIEIEDGWVFMLNRYLPRVARLNGCMKATWMEADNG